MAPPMKPAPAGPARRPSDETSFTRNMRFEIADAEGRALLWSYTAAIGLGVIWLLAVWLMPSPPPITLLPAEEVPVEVTFADAPPAPTPAPAAAPAAAAAPKPAGGNQGQNAKNLKKMSDAFGGGAASGGGGMVGDVSNALRGVDVSSSSGGSPGMQGKAVIGYGQGGQGSRTPGRGGLGTGLGAGGGGVGGVGGTGVGYSGVLVAAPQVIHATNVGGKSRNTDELGNYVRGRQSQLQFCYTEYGLKANPSLAGRVTADITINGGGAVTDVAISDRTWSGAGSAEAENCIKQRIAGWHFPPSDAGGGTFQFSFSFSK
ncbi:MAG TPA: AgmX/PglI C-terminal domain-containing protein [Gemmatimonadaceae bacterium]|nr:AgmX/PglI C-terminal domain-containing protein [Gemmatimonadaceae bacterium]